MFHVHHSMKWAIYGRYNKTRKRVCCLSFNYHDASYHPLYPPPQCMIPLYSVWITPFKRNYHTLVPFVYKYLVRLQVTTIYIVWINECV